MARHALVIGSQTYGLKAVLWDAERMRAALESRRFSVDYRVGQNATRKGILAGYERLIRTCSEGDSAVVYFSGHGGRVLDPDAQANRRPRFSGHEQFIVPEDFPASRDGDFRGITAPELSALQARLTSATRNVAVILDCCYAAGMSRAPNVQVKALEATPYGRIVAHQHQLRTRGIALGSPQMDGNPHAVRLAAAGMDEPAFECQTDSGRLAGALTDALLVALEEAGALPVSWEVIGRRVRELVIGKVAFQRPEIEGPVERIAFGQGEVASSPGLPYFFQDGRHCLRGGRLHGVCVGDEYLLMPFPASAADPPHALARASVTRVDPGSCEVHLTENGRLGVIPAGAPAFLVRSAARKRSVLLVENGAEKHFVEELRRQLAASAVVQPASEGESDPYLGTVKAGAAFIELRDRDGFCLAYPLRIGPSAGIQAVQAVEALARAQALRELQSGTEANLLKDEVSVEWGVVENGEAQPLLKPCRQLRLGERVYVRLLNGGAKRLYASIFDIGVAGRITLLSRAQPSGMLLDVGIATWLGVRQSGDLVGIELRWPEAVPPGAPGLESLVIIITDQPQDLRLLESSGSPPRVKAAGPQCQLRALMEQLAWGRARDLTAIDEGTPAPYKVQRLEFLLECPKPPAPA